MLSSWSIKLQLKETWENILRLGMFYFFPSTLLKCFWARHWIQLQVCSLVTDHAPYSVCHSFIHYFQGQLITQLQDLSVLSDHGKIEQCMFKKKKTFADISVSLYPSSLTHARNFLLWFVWKPRLSCHHFMVHVHSFTASWLRNNHGTNKKRHAAAVVRAALCKEKTWCKQKMEKNSQ